MLELIGRYTTSKGWSYFWIAWAVGFMVFDLVIGSWALAGVMAAFAIFEIYFLVKKYRGNHRGYNEFHGKQVA